MTQHDKSGAAHLGRLKLPTPQKGLYFLIFIAVMITLLVLVARTQRSAEGPFIPEAEPEALSVTVAPAHMRETLILNESFSGLVVARRTSQLGFAAGGRVIRIEADIGDRVQAGQPLGKLDTRSLTAQLTASRANAAEARANYQLSRTVVERQSKLFERGHVAQQRVDEATAQASAAAARIEAAMAQSDALEVAIDLAVLRAPFSGTVTQRLIDEGAIALPGAPILEIVEDRKLEARIGLPAMSAATIKTGQEVELLSERGPVPAKMRSSTGIVDRTQRTVTVIFDITSPELVDPGAIVRLSLERGVDERGFWVPVSALSESSRGLWSIYIAESVDGGWRASPQLVEIVQADGGRAYVRGTVRDGDQIILDGLSRLVPGQAVVLVDDASAIVAAHESEG
ncbi:MAG: efflux RND transporter periplasmic adaptor subunit [Hyphomonadaceae bacterium]